MQVDEEKLNALMGKMVGEFGAIASAPLVVLGDRLGLYKAMAGAGPMTADQLSEKTRLRLRYAQEWLNAQAASGFVEYDPREQTYALSPEAAMVLADDASPTFMGGGYEVMMSMYLDLDKSCRRRSSTAPASAGTSTAPASFPGPSASFAPATTPISSRAGSRPSTAWPGGCAPARRVADVGCGFGASTSSGQGVSEVELRRLRLPRALDCHRARAGARGRRRRRVLRGRRRQDLPGPRLRPGRLLRLPARHGRPGRRCRRTSRDAGRRRHPG